MKTQNRENILSRGEDVLSLNLFIYIPLANSPL